MDRKLKIGQYYIVTKDFSDKYNSFYEGDLLEILDEKDYGYGEKNNFFSSLFKKKKDKKIGLIAYYKAGGEAGGIHIIIDDENVILDNVVLEDSTYLKWKSLGFTDGLTRELGIKLSHAYENMTKILVSDYEDKGLFRIYNTEVDTIAFPVLRQIIGITPEIEFSDNVIIELLNKLSEYLQSDEHKKFLESPCVSLIDNESESIINFIKIIYG